jgi:hypothetical protein
MQFYNSNGIVVTDTAFITPNGDQYPIRNISSVKVRKVGMNGKLLGLFVAVCLLILAFSVRAVSESAPALPSASEVPAALRFFNNALFLLCIVGVSLIIWYFLSGYTLLIGAGGMEQAALSFRRWRKHDLNTLRDIAAAINASIANLQKT